MIRSAREPFQSVGGLVALFGSLAPGGAILKRSAADARLFESEGRAVVFDSLEDLSNRIDDPALDVKADDFLVLKNAGPRGAPGMPEAGYLPIPMKLSRAGVKDMVRISDARMSGTAFGTIVLHVTPEAATGGPLARVQQRRPDPDVGEGAPLDLLVDPARARAPGGRGAAGRAGPRLSPALPRARAAGRRRLRLRLPANGALTQPSRSAAGRSRQRLGVRLADDHHVGLRTDRGPVALRERLCRPPSARRAPPAPTRGGAGASDG